MKSKVLNPKAVKPVASAIRVMRRVALFWVTRFRVNRYVVISPKQKPPRSQGKKAKPMYATNPGTTK